MCLILYQQVFGRGRICDVQHPKAMPFLELKGTLFQNEKPCRNGGSGDYGCSGPVYIIIIQKVPNCCGQAPGNSEYNELTTHDLYKPSFGPSDGCDFRDRNLFKSQLDPLIVYIEAGYFCPFPFCIGFVEFEQKRFAFKKPKCSNFVNRFNLQEFLSCKGASSKKDQKEYRECFIHGVKIT